MRVPVGKVTTQGVACGCLARATLHGTEVYPNRCRLLGLIGDRRSVLQHDCPAEYKQVEDIVMILLVRLQQARGKIDSIIFEKYSTFLILIHTSVPLYVVVI